VGGMLTDATARYFENKDEFYRYAQGQTDTIGYVEAAATWVRLPAAFTVMGELHTGTNVADLVKATGTKKFRHEGYTEVPEPPEGGEAADALTGVMGARAGVLNQKFGVAQGDATPHHGEDFYPKVMRVLAPLLGITRVDGDFPAERVQLRFAILDVRRQHAAAPDAFPTYGANQQLFDDTAEELADAENQAIGQTTLWRRMAMDGNASRFDDFYNDYRAHADAQIAAIPVTPAHQEQFDTHHRKPQAGFQNATHRTYEFLRDRSMYQHIKAAQGTDCLLFGMGIQHYNRLRDLLEADGIPHTTVGAFLEEQKQTHP